MKRMYDDLINRAIEIFHKEKPGLPRPGDVIAHQSDERAYEVRSVDGESVTGFYIDEESGQEVVKQFPANEVFNPGSVMKIAKRIQGQMN
jgi:hypothetical protein